MQQRFSTCNTTMLRCKLQQFVTRITSPLTSWFFQHTTSIALLYVFSWLQLIRFATIITSQETQNEQKRNERHSILKACKVSSSRNIGLIIVVAMMHDNNNVIRVILDYHVSARLKYFILNCWSSLNWCSKNTNILSEVRFIFKVPISWLGILLIIFGYSWERL